MSGEFLAGFIIALVTAVGVFMVFRRKKSSQVRPGTDEHSKEFEELGKLTGQLAHEIKNPLSTIKINLKLISEDLEELEKVGAAQSGGGAFESNSQAFKRPLRKIAVIRKEADRLEQILEGFLRYVARTELQLVDVDINELVSDMIDFYSPQAGSHRIMIRQGLCTQPLLCRVDADMLKQVLLNLFINAQEAMDGGGELIVRTDRHKEMAVIEISDTGEGVAAEKLVRIFDPYYSSKPRGSGLGLPTAKKIIQRHNGRLSVNSTIGKGTSFLIKLPLIK